MNHLPDGETLLILLLLAGGLAPVLISVLRRSPTGVMLTVAGGLIAVSGAVWAMRVDRPSPADELDLRPRQSEDNGYVSSKTCRACHAEQYASWHGSYHRTMTQVASPDTIVGDFDDVTIQGYGWQYQLHQRGDEFFVEMDPALGLPAQRKVVMTTGSHCMQDVWVTTEDGNSVELVESVFLFSEQRWVPREAVFMQPPRPDETRADSERDFWNARCIRCHSTGPQPHASTNDTLVGELGIACEACHGPAADHLAANRDPLRRYEYHLADKNDESIVDPARLSAKRASQICGSCHSHAAAHNDHGRWSTFPDDGSSFRPGQDLADSLEVDRISSYTWRPPEAMDARFWPDGMVRGSGREYSDVSRSPCFNGADTSRQMSCLSCHAMHQPADDPRELKAWAQDQLKPGMDGDQGCSQCHAGKDTVRHTHHAADSSGSRCYNCHMPYTNFGLLKSIRAHLNTNPDVATTLATGRPNACNACHLDKTLGWTADKLFDWYQTPRPELTEEQQSIASSVLWALRGDAAQRVLTAATMGQQAPQVTAGNAWLAPYLLQLMKDPYAAVRYVAYHSLQTLPGFETFSFDYVGDPASRARSLSAAHKIWDERLARTPLSANPQLLVGADGLVALQRFRALVARRDNRPVGIQE